ncbi:ferric uptake regulation protein FUR [Lachnospiraceae bacterium KM106-2]|nr:ferric uptake regulation protein FUR [Lachnospiraceae bacterium KM106-2]
MKEMIVEKLKNQGCRITKQRLLLIDIILENECASCKEIYYKAVSMDPKIGRSTVYRMINMLEEIGVINRRNLYQVVDLEQPAEGEGCMIRLQDGELLHLTSAQWNRVVQTGLRTNGYL